MITAPEIHKKIWNAWLLTDMKLNSEDCPDTKRWRIQDLLDGGWTEEEGVAPNATYYLANFSWNIDENKTTFH